MPNKGESIIESSFLSPESKGLLDDKEELKPEQDKVEGINEISNNSEKEPLVIPSSFISSESNNSDNKLNIEKKDNKKKVDEVVKKVNKKNVKVKNPVKKSKPKVYREKEKDDEEDKDKKVKITRVTRKELLDSPFEDCWVILQALKCDFDSVKLSKKYFKECYIGRHERNYLQINSDLISSLHCKIFYKYKDKNNPNSPIEVFITDTSTNGTFINGKIIGKGKTKQIYHGQEIGFIIDSKRGQSGAFIVIIPRSNEVPGEYERSIEEDYEIGELLGSGNFADVRKGMNRYQSEEVAIKILEKRKLMLKSSSKMVISLEREINILKSIKHENIIQIYDVYEDNKYVYLVLELAKGGELFDRIKQESLTEPQARRVMTQLFEALEYLHNQGIAHRDLKPENILLVNDNDFTIKISDFGLARFVDENFYMRTLCGTLTYAAPEVTNILKNKEGKYTIAVDMWSCGVILFVCLCGYLPFNEGQQIKKDSILFRSPYWDDISNEAKDLVKGLLTIDPNKRLTVRQALEHPFITGYKNKNPRKRVLEESDQNVLNPDESIASIKRVKPSVLYSKDFSPSRSLSSLSLTEEQQTSTKRQTIKK